MEEIKKDREYPFLIFVLASCIVASLIHLLFFTTQGSQAIAKFFLKHSLNADIITFEKSEGTLAGEFSFENIEIRDLKFFPSGNILKAQKITLSLQSFDLKGFTVDLFNARIWLEDSDPILVYGQYQQGVMDFYLYTKNLHVYDLLHLFMSETMFRHLAGIISNVDISIGGSLIEPVVQGHFFIDRLSYKNFLMEECFADFNFNLKDLDSNPKIFGQLVLKDAKLTGGKTAMVRLEEAKIGFLGSLENPVLDVKAQSSIETVEVSIKVEGTLKSPQLHLVSNPLFSQERLLLMIATGKRWPGLDVLMEQKTISPDLASDFLDYFLFSGQGRRIADSFGITDFSIIYDERTKGLRVTQSLGEKTQATYGIEQVHEGEGRISTIQKLKGEHMLSPNLSIGIERKFKQADSEENPQGLKTSDQILFKYKKGF